MVVAAQKENPFSQHLQSSGVALLSIETATAKIVGEFPGILLLHHHQPQDLCTDQLALVLQGGWFPAQLHCNHAVAIVDSASRNAKAAAAAHRLPALTCGLSSLDTFTLSSLTADSAVIALRRQICALDGSVTEPFELPVTFGGGVEPFELLSAAAALCLLGEHNPLVRLSRWHIPSLHKNF
ncbi:MAG: hypothetical protein HFG20_09680 [Anaerotruncus sp.]|nr:hypothetical protein [Anaerotruncus sp.]